MIKSRLPRAQLALSWFSCAFLTLGAAENKKELGGMLLFLRTSVQKTDSRGSKNLSAPEKKSFILEIYTHALGEVTSPEKIWEFPESLAGLIIDYHFRTKPAHKCWERWLFFQMHKSWQGKNNKPYEEKGKHGPIKRTNLHKLTLKKWKSMNYPTKTSKY